MTTLADIEREKAARALEAQQLAQAERDRMRAEEAEAHKDVVLRLLRQNRGTEIVRVSLGPNGMTTEYPNGSVAANVSGGVCRGRHLGQDAGDLRR